MRLRLTAFLAALGLCASAHAQDYPSRPIRIVVPFAVGGIADTFARVIAQKASEEWSQPVVVENKAGAGGNIGADAVAKSPPDGYTLVMGSIGTHAVNRSLVKAMPYDTLKDFAPVAFVLEADGLLVVNSEVKATSVKELAQVAAREPLSYASAGVGSTSHLAGELFGKLAGVKMTHIPYKGNSAAITDLLGARTSMMFATMPTVLPQVKAGRLRALAVIGSSRSAAMPDLPTVAEAGVPGFELINWIGLFAPAGTPTPIVARWNALVQKVMSAPEIQARVAAEGSTARPMSAEQFGAFVRAEADRWAKLIPEMGIKQE